MPRRPRLELPGIPLHVVQRGVNRAAVFVDDDDRGHYRALLHDHFNRQQVALHAYVLMGNHIHLLASAGAAGAISRALRNLGQCYVQAFNRRHGRTGTLWEGRFKSSLVDTQAYLLTVYRYIELNPVRAAMAAWPEDYRWSSARANLGLRHEPLVTPHPAFSAFVATASKDSTPYRDWLHAPIDTAQTEAIRMHIQQERALGQPRFQAMVAKALNRPVAVRPRGRPLKIKLEGVD